MGRSVDDIIARLPRERRLKVEAKARTLARDMIDHADSLGEIRKAKKFFLQLLKEIRVQFGGFQNLLQV